MEYKKLLEEAYSQLPVESSKSKRFEIPKPNVGKVGHRTILRNFREICDAINRDHLHFLKFLSKEMATAGTANGTRAINKNQRINLGVMRRFLKNCDSNI